MTDVVECPYCDGENEASGCHETDSGLWECRHCEKEFEVYIDYSPNYHASKIEPSGDEVGE